MRLSNEAFAIRLGIGVRTVSTWHKKPKLRQQSEMQQLLDTALEQASDAVRARFATLTADPDAASKRKAADAELRLSTDPNISAALEWLDQHAGWESGTARRDVAGRLATVDVGHLQDRATSRSQVDQRRIAEALAAYYGSTPQDHGQYGATYGHDDKVTTSILTRPTWLDLACELTPSSDHLTVASTSAESNFTLDEETAATRPNG
jgi:hypothetical protein